MQDAKSHLAVRCWTLLRQPLCYDTQSRLRLLNGHTGPQASNQPKLSIVTGREEIVRNIFKRSSHSQRNIPVKIHHRHKSEKAPWGDADDCQVHTIDGRIPSDNTWL